jgi:hypothetical protein
LLRGDGTERPAYYTLRALTRELGSVPKFLGFLALAPETFGFLFAGPVNDVAVVWAKTNKPARLDFGAPVEVLHDLTAEPVLHDNLEVTQRPVLVRAPRNTATSTAWRQAAKRAVPAWDARPAQEPASLTAGQPPQGIHVAGAVPLKCTADPCEFDLEGRFAASFAVDPNYLGYQGRTVDISITVRSHGAGNPGFNLKYESERALNTLDEHGMRRVSDWINVAGTTPMTFHWKVKDAQFVGKYGANIIVDCDVPRFCGFGVLNLSVTAH